MIASAIGAYRWAFHYAHGKADELMENDVFYCSEPQPAYNPWVGKGINTVECKLLDDALCLNDAVIFTIGPDKGPAHGYLIAKGDVKGITDILKYPCFQNLTTDEKQSLIDWIRNESRVYVVKSWGGVIGHYTTLDKAQFAAREYLSNWADNSPGFAYDWNDMTIEHFNKDRIFRYSISGTLKEESHPDDEEWTLSVKVVSYLLDPPEKEW